MLETTSEESNYGHEEGASEWLNDANTIPDDHHHHHNKENEPMIEMSRTSFLKAQIDRMEEDMLHEQVELSDVPLVIRKRS